MGSLGASMPGSPLPLPLPRRRGNTRSPRAFTFGGTDCSSIQPRFLSVLKVVMAVSLTAICLVVLQQAPSDSRPNDAKFSKHEDGVIHVLVTGGAGYIGSHAALRLLEEGHRVTIVDNLSRGNIGAIEKLQHLFPEPGRLQFIYADLGDSKHVNEIFAKNAIDAVMHFAAVAYVSESMAEPLQYYHNITFNTLTLLEAMKVHKVKTLIYSSTCATYGEPKEMPITEDTPQVPINPYGKAKKMAEDLIKDYARTTDFSVMILRYFNVIGSDPKGRLGEAPRPELRKHARISGACFDAATGIIPGLEVRGTDYNTSDGTCIRDYIHVSDLVDAHVKAMLSATPQQVGIYNVGTGRVLLWMFEELCVGEGPRNRAVVGMRALHEAGAKFSVLTRWSSVKEFVEACKAATGVNINVRYLDRRPGDYAQVYSDPSKIQRELKWDAKYTNLRESLEIAWKWHTLHQNGYNSTASP